MRMHATTVRTSAYPVPRPQRFTPIGHALIRPFAHEQAEVGHARPEACPRPASVINRVEGRAETCGGHESPEPQHEIGTRLAGAVAPLCQVVQIRAAPISLVTADRRMRTSALLPRTMR